jgi:hypothetical protein
MRISPLILRKQILGNLHRSLESGCDLSQARDRELRSFSLNGRIEEDVRALINDIVDELKEALDEVADEDIPLLSEDDFPDWYTGPQEGDRHWPALETYLVEDKKWSAESVGSIDSSSTAVLSKFAPPGLPGFAVRGLVIGHVQSGKTANMTAVIAKAVDRGFRLIVVLGGLTDALRSQTQRRMESDLVRRLPESWLLLTSAEVGGDFHGGTISAVPSGGSESQIKLLVLKKQTHRLDRFIEKLSETSLPNRRNMKALIIDDESDQASVNVSEEYDPSAINSRIRKLLQLLPCHVYLGYTATPFANVLINPHAAGIEGVADDLYPKNFIEALPTPPDYFGAEKIFGRDLLDAEEVAVEFTGLDVIRRIPEEDIEVLRPKRGHIEEFEPEVTPALSDAIGWFVIATAIRNEPDEHSSMLIHTTELVVGHQRLRHVVEGEVRTLLDRVRQSNPATLRKLETLWKQEAPSVDQSLPGRSWKHIRKHLAAVLESIEVIEEHGQSEDRLDYSESDTGKRYIAIGGNVLARGLTIEGLVVSFFLRAGRQYDTLLQMGRWFGYRRGYEDLPRIWMTDDMADAFRDLATVEAEIREDVAVYARDRITPRDFAVRIRQVPGMLITRKSAMGAAEECDLSYSGEHVQTFRFYRKNREWLDDNWRSGSRLLEAAALVSSPEKFRSGYVFRDVDVESVQRFLVSYGVHDTHEHIKPIHLLRYIDRYKDKDLKNWSIGVICPQKGTPSQNPLGPLGYVSTVQRTRLNIGSSESADIKALMSRNDVLLDVVDANVASDDWEGVKAARSRAYAGAAPPLLLLYPILASSEPKKSEKRLPLDAAMDVLGIGVVFPGQPKEARKYVRVRLEPVAADEA